MKEGKDNTVGILIPDTFENRTFSVPVLEWFGGHFEFRHSKTGPDLFLTTSLDRFIIEKGHKKKILYNKTV
jgi:hypothetical protein